MRLCVTSGAVTSQVTTADETGAGARNVVVYVKLRGTAGETRWLELSRPGLQGFPTGSTQEFHNVYGKDVGTMQVGLEGGGGVRQWFG